MKRQPFYFRPSSHNDWAEVLRLICVFMWGLDWKKWPKWLEGFVYTLAMMLSFFYREENNEN